MFAFPDSIIATEPETDVSENTLSIMFIKIDRLLDKAEKNSLSMAAREEFNKWHMENDIKTQNYISGLLQSSYGKIVYERFQIMESCTAVSDALNRNGTTAQVPHS